MKRCQVALAWFLAFLCFAAFASTQDGDASLRLPAEILRRNVGLQLLDGVDDSALNSTASAQRGSPFNPASKPSVSTTTAPNASWEHEVNESVYKFTRDSQFGVKASTKGPFFRAAARLNTQKFSSVSKQEVLMYAYMQVIAKESQVRMHSITRETLSKNALALLDKATKAAQAGDQKSLRALRESFRAAYGTGFLAGLTEGGIYVIEGRERVESEQERQKLDAEIEGAVSGVKGSSTLKTENLSEAAKRFLSKKGQFFGGDPQAGDADFASFVAIANQWKTSVLTNASMQDRLSGIFIPYTAIPIFQAVASGPPIEAPFSLHYLRPFGPLDSPQSGVLLSYVTDEAAKIISSPVFFPSSMVLDPSRGLIELETRLDISAVNAGQPRQAALSELKRFSPGTSIEETLKSTSDAFFDRQLIAWPYIELLDEFGAEAQTLEPTGDSNTMSAYVDRAVFKSGPNTFSFQTEADPAQWQSMIAKGRVRLRTALSFDLINIVLTPPLVLESPKEPQPLGQRTRLALADKPWITPTDGDKMLQEMETRFNYLAYGPPYRSQPVAPGLVALKAKCCRNKSTNEYQFAGRYCRPSMGELAVSGGEFSTKFDPYGKLRSLAPEGMELVVLQERKGNDTSCRGDAECDDAGEPCESFHLDEGCYVDSSWYAWYRRGVDARLIKAEPGFVCRKPNS